MFLFIGFYTHGVKCYAPVNKWSDLHATKLNLPVERSSFLKSQKVSFSERCFHVPHKRNRFKNANAEYIEICYASTRFKSLFLILL